MRSESFSLIIPKILSNMMPTVIVQPCMGHAMRKPDFYICENKDADQFCINCTAD